MKRKHVAAGIIAAVALTMGVALTQGRADSGPTGERPELARFDASGVGTSVRDFALGLFKACYAQSIEESSTLTQDALVFLKRWRDSVRYQSAFETLSEEYANILGIEKDLQNRDIRKLVEVDFFRLIDKKIQVFV